MVNISNYSEYYLIIDRNTGQQLAKFVDQSKVMPYASKLGMSTVKIKKIKRKEKCVMTKPVNETSLINLTEMKIEKVKEDLILPKTNDPDQEAEQLTDKTGIYHYAVDDDITGKPAIVRTNVKALNEEEWIKNAFYTKDSTVIEPNNFEKTDEFGVSSIDQVAEGYDKTKWEAGYEAFENGDPCPSDPSEKDGWMEAKKEHRKSGQMNETPDADKSSIVNNIIRKIKIYLKGKTTIRTVELTDLVGDASSEVIEMVLNYLHNTGIEIDDKWNQIDEADYDRGSSDDWNELGIGLFRHKYLPLAYDDNSGSCVLYDISNASGRRAGERAGAEFVDTFDSPEAMNAWIDANVDKTMAEEYKQIAENADGPNDRGVDNSEGSIYGPAPEEDQNDLPVDKDGKFKLKEGATDFEAMMNDKNENGEMIGDSVNSAIRHYEYAHDAADHVFGKHFYNKPYAEWEKIKPEVISHFKSYGLKESESIEEKFTPKPSSFETYINLPNRDDVEVDVHYEIEESDPSVGYQGGVMITSVTLKGTDDDIMDQVNPADANRLFDEAQAHATDQFADYGDYKYDQMRDERMNREYEEGMEEGKDWRFDPEADDDDYDRQDRMKGRQRDQKGNRKEVDESDNADEEFKEYDLVKIDAPRSEAHGEFGHVRGFEDGYYEVMIYGTGFKGYYTGSEISHATQEQADAYYRQPHSLPEEIEDSSESDEPLKEGDKEITRGFLISVDFTLERVEIEYKGMIDIESALAMMADGGSIEPYVNELNMGGLPLVASLDRDNNHTLMVLNTNYLNAPEIMVNMPACQELLAGLEIDEDSFYGFLVQGSAGAVMDDSTELEEDEDFVAPEFVVSSENVYAEEMAEDPMFIQSMNAAYLTVAEKYGENVESFNPSMDQVDEVIDQGIDNYPNGQRYSFMMTDSMARDAIIAAFGLLWDQGKIGSENM